MHSTPGQISILGQSNSQESSPPINRLNKEIKILAKKAVQKLEIVKPLTKAETNISTKALTTSRNSPMVTTVSGRVNRMSKGFTTALAKPSSRAAIRSEPPSAKRKPLKR